MGRSRALQTAEREPGAYQIPEQPIPDDATEVAFELPRCTSSDPSVWDDPTTLLTLDTEASFDGGRTWVYAGGIEAFGGVYVRRDGTEARASVLRVPYPPGKGRLVRGTITTAKRARIAVDLEAK